MSCNCRGDRYFVRPVEDRCHVQSSNVRPDHDCRCGSNCNCGGCGYHGCRCNAESVIKGCCTGGVGGATLKDGLCAFVNRKVLIRIGCETLCVVIAEVCDCVLKAICPRTGKVLYFNLDRIVDVQDIYS